MTVVLLLFDIRFGLLCYFKKFLFRFRAPEVLFRPDLIGEEYEGLHEVLVFSIQKSDMDLRKELRRILKILNNQFNFTM
jgi:hypothetical protein